MKTSDSHEKTPPTVRPMAAGPRGFYPTDAAQLRAKLDQMLDAAAPTPDDAPPSSPPLAIIVPHAGYSYSGPTAARLREALAEDYALWESAAAPAP